MAIDKEIKNLSFIITVNDNCEIEIGKEYTDLLDLKPGDEFDIKLGRKGISLLRPGTKMFVWADDKENQKDSNLIKEENSYDKVDNSYMNDINKPSTNERYSYSINSDKEDKKYFSNNNKRFNFFSFLFLSPFIIALIVKRIDPLWVLICIGSYILAYKVLEVLYHLTKPPEDD